ncbi:hypothetical protein [Ottowia beijingensis]|uniref:hypothetical protein n=1 Tax=Ottowia beijingensis TaxID=1207057 RepID=UPI00214DD385|nr:hypothetical protein [Ottowia beijingensis]
MNSEQLAEFKQFGDRVSRDRSFISMVASDSREAQDLSARLASTTARTERADASLNERSAFAERVSTAYERGETISIDIAQDPHNLAMFTRYAEQYGGNSASARVLMEAELARQSLQPNRVFSDGTAVPSALGTCPSSTCRIPAALPLRRILEASTAPTKAACAALAVGPGLRRRASPRRPCAARSRQKASVSVQAPPRIRPPSSAKRRSPKRRMGPWLRSGP